MVNYKAIGHINTTNWTDQYTSGSDFKTGVQSASANTFGSWLEINSDIGKGKVLKGIMICTDAGLTAFQIGQLEIGEGAGASEVMKLRCAYVGTTVGYMLWIPFNYRFTDNARITFRHKSSVASALNLSVILYYQ